MDDFDDGIQRAFEAGQRNANTLKLLKNWCEYAEVSRSGGVGMVEAQTGLPIGHMGMQCKYSKHSSMHCWLLEDSVFSFYKKCCRDCDKRVPVSIPNILEFVEPRLQKAEERKKKEVELIELKKKAQCERKLKRAELRPNLSFEETFVLDLLDELDIDALESDDPRLEKLAHLAPEVFTPQIVDLLLQAVEGEDLPYSHHAARALITAPIDDKNKLTVAIYLIKRHFESSDVVNVVLSNSYALNLEQLKITLRVFASLATEPPPSSLMYSGHSKPLDAEPLKRLFGTREAHIYEVLTDFFKETELGNIQTATRVLIGLNNSALFSKFLRDIVALLMRRRILLPNERRESSIIFYLRKAVSLCLFEQPELTDEVIQKYLADNDPVGVDESNRIYDSILRFLSSDTEIGSAHKIAFRRLLWAAIEHPDNYKNRALDTFRHTSDEFSVLAHENFDDLIGAAATLTEKYEQIDKKNIIEVADSFLDELERNNKKNAINSLQSSLVNLAAVGAKHKGNRGIEDFLGLYRNLPKNQEQMRGCMITHISKMVTGISSLNLVLSDWYGALMDESVLVRASAIKAWENVPFEVVKNFPDLFFDAFSLALSDPYKMVHKSAVGVLRYRSFPEEKRLLIKIPLWNLVLVYSKGGDDGDFLVDCINLLVSLCLSDTECKGAHGQLLSAILLKQEGSALYHAVNQSGYRFKTLPSFLKVALKAIQDSYTRGISISDCKDIILSSTKHELINSKEEIVGALELLKPLKQGDFLEAITYATALSISGDSAIGANLFNDFANSIPEETRHLLWRIQTELVATALQIESEIQVGNLSNESTQKWQELIKKLEKEHEERAEFRDFPPGFNF